MKRIIELVKTFSTEESKIIDIGCGDGTFLNELKGKLFGVDISQNSCVEAERILGVNATIVNADARQIPLQSSSFDIIICSEVLEHIPHAEKAVSEIMRIAKPGAKIIVSIPNEKVITIGRALMLKFPPKLAVHVNDFGIADIERMFGKRCAARYFVPAFSENLCTVRILVFEK